MHTLSISHEADGFKGGYCRLIIFKLGGGNRTLVEQAVIIFMATAETNQEDLRLLKLKVSSYL